MQTLRIHYKTVNIDRVDNLVPQSQQMFTLVPPLCQLWHTFLKIEDDSSTQCVLPTRTVSVYTVLSLLCVLGHFTLVTVLLSVGSIIFLISWTTMAGFLCSSGAHLLVMKQTGRGVGSRRGTPSSSVELRGASWMRRCLSRVLVAGREVWVELVGSEHTRKGNSSERGGW